MSPIPASPSRFPTTQWETLNDLRSMPADERRDALGALLERYRPALLAYTARFFKIQEADAADLVQDFVADRILSGDLFAVASRDRGRLRRLLQVALRNHCINRLRASRPDDAGGVRDQVVPSPDSVFERSWAEIVVNEAAARLERQYADEGRLKHMRLLAQFLEAARGETVIDDHHLGIDLGVTPRSVQSMRQNVKLKLISRMRDVVGEYVEDQRGVDDELDELKARLQG